MNPLFKAAREIQEFMQARDWRFCFIGGLAVIRWGEIRATQDIDATLLTGFGGEQRYVDELLQHFDARIADAEVFAMENRVALIAASNGVAIDISLGGIPFETEAVGRATLFDFAPGCSLLTCSAEDLVIFKAFADRDKDWADVHGILIRQSGRLDWPYMIRNLEPLCEVKGAPRIISRLREMRAKVE